MADPSYNYSYTPTVDHRESNLYIEEYYSSTDTKIFFDDEQQTEIGFISYDIQEQLKPIYGYNSRTFDDVVIGNRIVVGQFTVPIKNNGKQVFEAKLTGSSTNTKKDSINQYNNNQQSALENTDWFGSTVKNIEKHDNKNIDSNYLVKLIALGYDVNTNSSLNDYERALKQFQSSNSISVNGVLNNITKGKIDEEFSKISANSVNLNGGTGYSDIYTSKNPTLLSGSGIILNTLNTSNGTVYEIMDSVGNKYYYKGKIVE